METQWKFAAIIKVDNMYKVEGLNIWNFYWQCTDRNVEVRDPFEGHLYHFKEYEICEKDKKVNFVAGEFSNGKVGIFTKEDNLVRNLL